MSIKEETKTIALIASVLILALVVYFRSTAALPQPETPAPTIKPPVAEMQTTWVSSEPEELPAALIPADMAAVLPGQSAAALLEVVIEDTGSPLWDVAIENTGAELLEVQPKNGVYTYHRIDDVHITAYCPCEICCGYWATVRPVDELGNPIVYTATGEIAVQGVTVAVNPEFIPHGAYVYIQNPRSGAWQEFRATDTSPSTDHVDVYYKDHAAALGSGYGGYGTVFWSMEPIDFEMLK